MEPFSLSSNIDTFNRARTFYSTSIMIDVDGMVMAARQVEICL